LIVLLRNQLAEQGLDAGPDTIAWHLVHRHGIRLVRNDQSLPDPVRACGSGAGQATQDLRPALRGGDAE
jgi:hypothetical protein